MSLVHWRLAAYILNHVGEENVPAKTSIQTLNVEVSIPGRAEKPSATGNASLQPTVVKQIKEPTKPSKRKVELTPYQRRLAVLSQAIKIKVQQEVAVARQQAEAMEVDTAMEVDETGSAIELNISIDNEDNFPEAGDVPDVEMNTDELFSQIEQVLDGETGKEIETVDTPVQEIASTAGTSSTVTTVESTVEECKFKRAESREMSSSEVFDQMQKGTMSFQNLGEIKIREEKWEEPCPSFKEVLLKPAPKPTEPLKMEHIGKLCSDREWSTRQAVLDTCKESQKISFVDSHCHIDRIKSMSAMSSLDVMLRNGPMPLLPVRLEAAVANFCHGVPSRDEMVKYKRDARLFFTYGIHPKEAKYVSQREIEIVKSAVEKDPRCVGIGEIGMEYTGGHSKLSNHQTRVLKDMLRFYVTKKLWSKVIVIHCRDRNDSRDASDMCLAVMTSTLEGEVAEKCKIHRHCYNGGIKENAEMAGKVPRDHVRFYRFDTTTGEAS